MAETNLLGRLATAAGQMQNPPLDSVNPHFKNKFSSLRAVSDAVRPALAANGLAYHQTIVTDDGGAAWVVTFVYGADGSIELARVPVTVQSNPQQMGSALTYAKRYCLQAAFGLVGEEDDDGEAASAQKSRKASGGTGGRKPAQKAADGPTDAEKAELAQIAEQYGDKRDVWNAYQANGMEGARALLAMVAPAPELYDHDVEFGS